MTSSQQHQKTPSLRNSQMISSHNNKSNKQAQAVTTGTSHKEGLQLQQSNLNLTTTNSWHTNSKKDIWNRLTPPPNSAQLDYLREFEGEDMITPTGTTISSSGTLLSHSFEDELSKHMIKTGGTGTGSGAGTRSKSLLEIPDLDQTMSNSNPTTPYYQRMSAQSKSDKHQGQSSLAVQQQHQQHRHMNPYYATMQSRPPVPVPQAAARPEPQRPQGAYYSHPYPKSNSRTVWPLASYQQIASQSPSTNNTTVTTAENRQDSSSMLSTPVSVSVSNNVPATATQQRTSRNDTYASRMRTTNGPAGLHSPRSHYNQYQQSHHPSSRNRSSSNVESRSTPYQSQHQHSPYPPSHHSKWQHVPYRNTPHSGPKSPMPSSPHRGGGHHHHHHHSQSYMPSSGTRPAPEVLKTLLRKKACLYEPGTSRAIALITWLVGRKLALRYGYFSRQRLQAGVHAVVAGKIESRMITRTKVNRCMQIILNSCFHYIIPRPDGTEEKGGHFCKVFAETVANDTHLLRSLASPWGNLDISLAEKVLEENGDVCPLSPPRGKGLDLGLGQDDDSSKPADAPGKRVVLLCFNENVRSAEDVLRCHNDFIRDAAITSNLHLSADEWKYFFSRKEDDCSQTNTTAESNASSAGIQSSPLTKGAEGCDIPYLSFDIAPEVSDCLAFQDSVQDEPWAKGSDVYGQMTNHELSKFRTTWCCKRYEHDPRLCRFAHVKENNGWLRRDPNKYKYSDKLCPYITTIKEDGNPLNGCHINACKDGVLCSFAHSQEEVDYHPKRYKSKVCETSRQGRVCELQDICPHSHPPQHGHQHSRQTRHGGKKHDSNSRSKGPFSPTKPNSRISDNDANEDVPQGAPVLYLNPAPTSEFEKSLQFEGLRGLYRRNCTIHYGHSLGTKGAKYTHFGEDCGLDQFLFKPERGNKDGFSLYSE